MALDRRNLHPAVQVGYAELARDILLNGFWMTRPPEQLMGWVVGSDNDQLCSSARSTIDVTCFTEVRLSQAEEHSKQYGLLGIGVERKFVLDRRGGPVHYVRNGPRETVVGNSLALFWYLQEKDAQVQAELMRRNIGFLKPMSNPGEDDYAYLDEHEWRIIHSHEEEKRGLIVRTGLERPFYRIPVQPADVRLIVFPDADTRRLATDDEQIRSFFLREKKLPIFLTLEDCRDF